MALIVAPWVCVLITPYGLDLPGYYQRVLDNPRLRDASSEWAATTISGQPMFFALVIASVVVVVTVAARRGLTSRFPLAVLGLTSVFGLLAVRNVVWFALASAAILPVLLDGAWPDEAPRRRRLNLGLALTGIALAIGIGVWASPRADGWVDRSYPTTLAAAVTRLRSLTGELRSSSNEQYADWLLNQDPALTGRIAYDIRFEVIGGRELDRIVAFRREIGANWQATVQPFGLVVLSERSDAGAVRWFEEMPQHPGCLRVGRCRNPEETCLTFRSGIRPEDPALAGQSLRKRDRAGSSPRARAGPRRSSRARPHRAGCSRRSRAAACSGRPR